MPWEEKTLEELAENLGIDFQEVQQKHKLISKIKKARKDLSLSQAELAEMVGVSQSRIARIEGGVGTKNMSFDLLFRILATLGFECRISVRKSPEEQAEAA